MTLTELFTGIANAIRGKDGTTATITAEDFPARISAIPSGGGSNSNSILTKKRTNSTRTLFTSGSGAKIGLTGTNSNPSYFLGTPLANDESPFIFNVASATNNCRLVINFAVMNYDVSSDYYDEIFAAQTSPNETKYGFAIGTGSQPTNPTKVYLYLSNAKADSGHISISKVIDMTKWYFASIYYDNIAKKTKFSLYNESGSLISEDTLDQPSIANNTSMKYFFAGQSVRVPRSTTSINFENTFFEVDGTDVWGKKNSITQNM